ncbi:hypothetical protein NDU88_002213 [Pleurodeles waltl]|uniref:Uncharacterized protein n=1 Tax=Pleurodeles waltl TaxID=8319 RepID=A0AAV7T1B6_PLEWA|nr:hypothetical protein NDU88_002213 [Pleurodeles waltl]
MNEDRGYSKRKRSNEMASSHRRSRPSNVRVGDCVLVRDRFPGTKLHLPFEDKPWTVTRRQGSLVVAERGSEQIARNVSSFKTFQPPVVAPGNDLVKDSCMAELEEAVEDNEPEKSQTDNDSGDNDQVPWRPDDTPVISLGELLSPKGRAPQSRFRLRSNPTPSTRLQDHLV